MTIVVSRLDKEVIPESMGLEPVRRPRHFLMLEGLTTLIAANQESRNHVLFGWKTMAGSRAPVGESVSAAYFS